MDYWDRVRSAWKVGRRSGYCFPSRKALLKESWELFKHLSPVIAALALTPLVFEWWTFKREREAAKPVLSVEDAFLVEHKSVTSSALSNIIEQITDRKIYVDYAASRFGAHDIRNFSLPNSTLNADMLKKLSSSIEYYRVFLTEEMVKLSGYAASLQSMLSDDVRVLGYRYLDSTFALDESQIRAKLAVTIKDKVKAYDESLDLVSSVKKILDGVKRSIYIRIYLLNRGATDGLIRHEGKINYRDNIYDIIRVPPPSSDLSLYAVPTYQVNQPVDEFSSQSVGQIPKDSMAEFWYGFEPYDQDGELCKEEEMLDIILHDHNGQDVRGAEKKVQAENGEQNTIYTVPCHADKEFGGW